MPEVRLDPVRVPSRVSPRLDFGVPRDDAERGALADIQTLAFLGTPTDETRAERLSRGVPSDSRVIRRAGKVAAGLHIWRAGQWFGGRRVPMAGIAGVGVAVEHRGTGAGSALMRATLEDLHADGFPISALYPATQSVYRQAGYEQAGVYVGYKLPTASIDTRDRALELRPADKSDRDRMRQAYEVRARRSSGNLDRHERLWDQALPGTEERLRSYIVAAAGEVQGYASFTHSYEDDVGHIWCRDVVALTRGAARRLLTMFADHRSQVKFVHWEGAPADALLLALAEQCCEVTERLLWMLRIVDVRTALESRGYPEGLEAELQLDVRDDVLAWNNARFTLQVSGGKAKVRRGGRGRLVVDVRGLAPLYTGHAGAAELQATGYVEGAQRELDAATRVFGGPSPWMPDFF